MTTVWASVASIVLRRAREGERGSSVSVLSAFYDVFVGASSFAAGLLANAFGYRSAFIMSLIALGASAIVARSVFAANDALASEPEVLFFEPAASGSDD